MTEVKLYIGPMFAGKTSKLITTYNKYNSIEGHKTIAIKPNIDNRYETNKIKSHDGDYIPAYEIDIDNKDFNFLAEYDSVFIDEIQFFTHPHNLLNVAFNNDVNLYMYGLSGTFNLNTFSTISKIIPYCTHIELFKSICYNCGEVANYSKKIIKRETDKLNEIEIGGSELYKPSCYACMQL